MWTWVSFITSLCPFLTSGQLCSFNPFFPLAFTRVLRGWHYYDCYCGQLTKLWSLSWFPKITCLRNPGWEQRVAPGCNVQCWKPQPGPPGALLKFWASGPIWDYSLASQSLCFSKLNSYSRVVPTGYLHSVSLRTISGQNSDALWEVG